MTEEKKSYALITGSSAGLGKAIAGGLAGRGYNLVLVALPGTGLSEISSDLEKMHGIVTHCFEADMCESDTPRLIKEFTTSKGIVINILVNNVGIGHGGEIGHYSDASITETIFLNLRCATILTNSYIDDLRSHSQS